MSDCLPDISLRSLSVNWSWDISRNLPQTQLDEVTGLSHTRASRVNVLRGKRARRVLSALAKLAKVTIIVPQVFVISVCCFSI